MILLKYSSSDDNIGDIQKNQRRLSENIFQPREKKIKAQFFFERLYLYNSCLHEPETA